MNSPCLTCTRVKDPKNCENKLCKDWQAWFIDRWDTMRKNLCAQAAIDPAQEVGVHLGGHKYVSPHRIREFLRVNPCMTCVYPADACTSPCPSKQAWIKMQSEVEK